MNAILTMFNLGPNMPRNQAEAMAIKFGQLHKMCQGLKNQTFISDEKAGDYGCMTVWDSKADAEAAVAKGKPELEQVLKGIVKGQPSIRVFDVFDLPK